MRRKPGSRVRRIRTAWAIAATVAMVATTWVLPSPALAAGGPIVLMGIDAEDGGVGGHGPITVYEDVVESVLSDAAANNGGILVIGGGKSAFDAVTAFWNKIDTDLASATVTYVNGAAISTQSFSGFEMLAVVSSQFETPSGGLTETENQALNGRQSDIANFVDSGNGLLGFTQSGLSTPYAYLGGVGAFTTTGFQFYDDITPTPAGSAIGITNDLDVCCWHDFYDTFPSFLSVLATDAFSGEVAAIGGANVTVGEGPPGDPSCSDGVDNDNDGLIDSDDPGCQSAPDEEGPPGDPTCSDGVDNDGDGDIDGDDSDCQAPPPTGKNKCRGQQATIVGTNGDDVIIGTAGDDVIKAKGGDDMVDGLGGDDTICGGTGNDNLLGRGGRDFLFGDGGNDTLDGGDGNDKLIGSRGHDTLQGAGGADLIRGGAGNDVVHINGGADEVYGGAGDDVLDTDGGADYIEGGPGDDDINAGDGNDIVFGNRGNDTIDGSTGTDKCNGGQGTDTAVRCETTTNVP